MSLDDHYKLLSTHYNTLRRPLQGHGHVLQYPSTDGTSSSVHTTIHPGPSVYIKALDDYYKVLDDHYKPLGMCYDVPLQAAQYALQYP